MAILIVKPGTGHVLLNLESDLRIGRSVVILNPACSSHWNDLPVLETPHALVLAPHQIIPVPEAIPKGQQTRGPMRSFCVEVENLHVFRAEFVTACCHTFCDGRYGAACPGGTSGGATMTVPKLFFRLGGMKADWVPCTSRSLALQLHEAFMPVNPLDTTPIFMLMERFGKRAVNRRKGSRLIEWFKAGVREGHVVTETFKVHTSPVHVKGDPLPRFPNLNLRVHANGDHSQHEEAERGE